MSNDIATQETNLIFSVDLMRQMQSLAELMAKGTVTVPKHLQEKPADCLAIIMQAAQWGMNPYAVAQKTHLVSGTLGYEAQLINAVVSSSNAIEGRFHYEYSDGEWSDKDAGAWVRVGAVPRGEKHICWGEPLYPARVTTKNSPLWKTAPKQQAAYLAVKYWCRMYCPAVILGVYTTDELEPREKDITPQKVSAIRGKYELQNTNSPEKQEEQSGETSDKTEIIQPDGVLDNDRYNDLSDILHAIKTAESEDKLLVIASDFIAEHIKLYPDDKPELTAAYKTAQMILKNNK